MQQSRETIAVALFDLLKVISFGDPPQTFQTTARKGRVWSDLPDAAQPAMFLFQVGETGSQPAIALYKWRLHFWCLIYLRADAADDGAGTTIETTVNAILDAIENTLQPIIGEKQTLGLRGVNNVWIEGEIIVDTGIIDQQCAIIIPLIVETGS